MNVLGLIAPVITAIGEILKGVIANEGDRQKILGDIESQLVAWQSRTLQAQRDIVLGEINGSWMQRNWRPTLMGVFGAIIANNYIIAPYVGALTGSAVYLPIPAEMWTLMTIGIGGYIGGRSGEKIFREWRKP